eukprot:TRINITY_DN5236_c0_g1::TRINITY_DN5236_c0_g1_i1::g.23430::m.23430 TRINITY_DN5236_c0_g1::TRINITY_DN5236_c0_g1_i1::g.23430  ORF type:complete len:377 (+),score=162.26,sp/M1CZC0/EBP1_SOLTU/51.43/7e-121,Peptidase_M24/PF00557.19/5e-27,Peptidase_M24/PF00557.19/1.5e+03 TRINITY_DN5236_c0_g1_i1:64-1194(+)
MDIDEIEEEKGIESPEVVTKYKMSADIANQVLKQIIAGAKTGVRVVDLCKQGDNLIETAVAGVFNKKGAAKIEKGIAFPTCVSVNNCVCNYSPLESESTEVLQDGDLVKIDLGVHIDGYIAQAGYSLVVGASGPAPATGKPADVLCAAFIASEIALRMLRPGNKNTQVTDAITKVASEFGCEVVEGLLSHQIKRFVIDGNRCIIGKSDVEHRVDEFEFQENEAYVIDIAMTTGQGKTKEMNARTTVFKRAVDQSYALKMKASRFVFSEINSKFPALPFTLRALEDEKRSRLGIVECLSHGLVHPYPVLFEKEGEVVARFSFTALITTSNTLRITETIEPVAHSEKSLQDAELQKTLKLSTKRSKKAANKDSAMDTS